MYRKKKFNLADSISWNETKISAMFQKHGSCRLCRVDADPFICNDCTGFWGNLELFCRKLDDGDEGSIFWDGEDPEGKIGIRRKCDLEGNF